MGDLISRKVLLERFKMRCEGNCKKCMYSTFLASDEHCGLIDEAPAVDAKMVIYGHDKACEFKGAHCEFWCSECGYWLREVFPGDCDGDFNYCPNCGADLRKKV